MDSLYDLFQRGTRLLEAGDFHAAAVSLSRARDIDPEKTSIREALGRAYFRSGAFEPARAEFEAVVERALKRARRQPAPGTTLHALERSFQHTPAAVGYVKALRESRYRDAPAQPTRAQRRGLRSELGRGGGVTGRLRAWWALPPR